MKVIINNGENTEQKITQDFFAPDIERLQHLLAKFVKETKCIQFDESTGLYWVKYGNVEDRNCAEKTAKEHYLNIFDTHCYLEKTVAINSSVKKQLSMFTDKQIGRTFKVVAHQCSYNSRQWFLEKIPKWDGIPRIDTFLKDAYECDADPNLFRLFITKVVSMIMDPAKTYCPYWFDFCGEQGVGKSYLADWLLSGDGSYVCKYAYTRSGDDFKYQPYACGAIIAIDDECKLSNSKSTAFGKGTTIEEWRAYVSDKFDTVRAVYKDEMVLRRSFVIIRTSNEAKITQQYGERRQIIFESKLQPRDCRLAKTEDYYKESENNKFLTPDGKYNGNYAKQLLAEAINYVQRFGQYELSEKDVSAQVEEQSKHIDVDNMQFQILTDFLGKIQNCIKLHKVEIELGLSKLLVTRKTGVYDERDEYEGLYYFTRTDYEHYCEANNVRKENIISRKNFWQELENYTHIGYIPIEIKEFYGVSKTSKSRTKACFIKIKPEELF